MPKKSIINYTTDKHPEGFEGSKTLKERRPRRRKAMKHLLRAWNYEEVKEHLG